MYSHNIAIRPMLMRKQSGCAFVRFPVKGAKFANTQRHVGRGGMLVLKSECWNIGKNRNCGEVKNETGLIIYT